MPSNTVVIGGAEFDVPDGAATVRVKRVGQLYVAVLFNVGGFKATIYESFLNSSGTPVTVAVAQKGLKLLPHDPPYDPPRYLPTFPLPAGIIALGPHPAAQGSIEELPGLMEEAFRLSVPAKRPKDLTVDHVLGVDSAAARCASQTRLALRAALRGA